eukprot:GHVU01126760.1.p1 GENE.GHVU01126760.1~~GHVU01126760.1.p1  ORF type:complete len:310 (-),score=43.35 GHVU01126760.1:455-1384(-)
MHSHSGCNVVKKMSKQMRQHMDASMRVWRDTEASARQRIGILIEERKTAEDALRVARSEVGAARAERDGLRRESETLGKVVASLKANEQIIRREAAPLQASFDHFTELYMKTGHAIAALKVGGVCAVCRGKAAPSAAVSSAEHRGPVGDHSPTMPPTSSSEMCVDGVQDAPALPLPGGDDAVQRGRTCSSGEKRKGTPASSSSSKRIRSRSPHSYQEQTKAASAARQRDSIFVAAGTSDPLPAVRSSPRKRISTSRLAVELDEQYQEKEKEKQEKEKEKQEKGKEKQEKRKEKEQEKTGLPAALRVAEP